MTQDTKNKFAEILAAQLSKANEKQANSFINKQPKEQPKSEPEANKDAELPELSDITIDDLLTDAKPLYCVPAPFELPTMKQQEAAKPKLQIVDYSERAFAVIGETKPIKDLLSSLGGSFNKWLKCGEGWIFSKKHLDNVKMKLAI